MTILPTEFDWPGQSGDALLSEGNVITELGVKIALAVRFTT